MQTRMALFTGLVLGSSIGITAGVAQRPAQGVNPGRHPNIAAAQDLTSRAYQRIVAAQQANEWDMNGHAARAKELLDQANRELGMAAGAANVNRR